MGTNENLHLAVATAMADIVAGDPGATWELHRLAEPSVRAMLRREARRVNAWISEDDLGELAIDAALMLAARAQAWKPGAALPWVWARHRINALVHQHLGTFTRELDESFHEIAEPALDVRSVDDPRAALRSLAARHAGALDLDRLLTAVANDRDADIYLGYRLEQAAGNRRPAVTVAADHGMQPAAVRKVVQRVHQRLGLDPITAMAA